VVWAEPDPRERQKERESRGLRVVWAEPDPNGQVWLMLAMQQAEVTKIQKVLSLLAFLVKTYLLY
jgi:hypothetical protein